MTNAISAVDANELRARRAAYLDDLMESERWSSRRAATALGVTHTYIGRRRNGEQDLSFEDVEMLAGLLKRSPEEFFAELRRAERTPRLSAEQKTPAPGPRGGSPTPGVLMFAPRLGLEPRTCRLTAGEGELIRVDFTRRERIAEVAS